MKLTPNQIAKLHSVFNKLDCDLPMWLVMILADKCKVDSLTITQAYEAWQVDLGELNEYEAEILA